MIFFFNSQQAKAHDNIEAAVTAKKCCLDEKKII